MFGNDKPFLTKADDIRSLIQAIERTVAQLERLECRWLDLVQNLEGDQSRKEVSTYESSFNDASSFISEKHRGHDIISALPSK